MAHFGFPLKWTSAASNTNGPNTRKKWRIQVFHFPIISGTTPLFCMDLFDTEPITQFIDHEPESDWKLIRTTPTNPRQMSQQKAWQPLPGLRKLRGHTPGSRRAILPDMACLWNHDSAEALTARIPKSGGRYFTGRITARHRGGKCSVKKWYKVIDFKRSILDEV